MVLPPASHAPVNIAVVSASFLSYASEQSGVPLFSEVTLQNLSGATLIGAALKVQVTPHLGDRVTIPVPPLPSGDEVHLGPIDYRVSPGRLREVREHRARHNRVVLQAQRHSRGTKDLKVLPFDEWPGRRGPPGLLACFITPNDPALIPLMDHRDCRARLAARGDGSFALSGEQAREVVGAIQDTVRALGLAPAPLVGQRIRFPGTVIAERLASPLSTWPCSPRRASSISGCVALVALFDGYALAGAWLMNDRFPEGVIEDAARLPGTAPRSVT